MPHSYRGYRYQFLGYIRRANRKFGAVLIYPRHGAEGLVPFNAYYCFTQSKQPWDAGKRLYMPCDSEGRPYSDPETADGEDGALPRSLMELVDVVAAQAKASGWPKTTEEALDLHDGVRPFIPARHKEP